jgi:hypothetical protein
VDLPAHPGGFECEIVDVATWGQLCSYFAETLRGGVALETFRREGAGDSTSEAVSRLQAVLYH